jgi:hypothetical protein
MDGFVEDETLVEVGAFFTTCFTTFDVLPPKFESPPYTAVIELTPPGNAEVVNPAKPPPNVSVPSTVVPFLNLTASPLGGAPTPEGTVALK